MVQISTYKMEVVTGQTKSSEQIQSKMVGVWYWWSKLFGKNKKRCENLSNQAKNVKENTWEKLKAKYVTEAKLKQKGTMKSFRTRRESVYAKINEMKFDLKEAVNSELAEIKQATMHNAAILFQKIVSLLVKFLVLGPIVFAFSNLWLNHHETLYAFFLYIVFVAMVLFVTLAMPKIGQNGVSFFTRQQLSADDREVVQKLLRKITDNHTKKAKQGVFVEEDRDKPTFILSIDGGGIKGITASEIVRRICIEFPDFLDGVDLIAGCSTGSIVAAMLCTGYTPEDVSETFRIAAPVVFRKTVWDSLLNFGCLFGPNHDGDGKLEMFQLAFRGLTMKDLNCGICITASHVEDELPGVRNMRCVPRVWTNVVEHSEHTYVGHHEFDESDEIEEDVALDEGMGEKKTNFSVLDMQIADIVNGATAPPIFFPSHQDHVDGGIWSNNPAMAAIATVSPKRRLENIHLLSISTGLPGISERSGFNRSKFGLLRWLPYIIDFLLDSTTKATHFNVKALLGSRYHRIDPILDEHVELNDVSALELSAAVGNNYDLSSTYAYLERIGFKRKEA